jgi:hypothetical protein
MVSWSKLNQTTMRARYSDADRDIHTHTHTPPWLHDLVDDEEAHLVPRPRSG